MATKSELIALAERCEAATAEQLHGILWEAFETIHGEPLAADRLPERERNAYILAEAEFISLIDAGGYLDAAMTLVPEGRADEIIRAAVNALGRRFDLHISFWPKDESYPQWLARFISAAALRARAAMMEDNHA